MKISRMMAAGEIIPLRRGLYLRGNAVNPLALASAIYGPSYVSFETALAWHGLIPERVEGIQSAAIKRSADFETPVGRFRYRAVPARVFAVGIERVDDEEMPWLLASPTKAICDRISLESSIRSQQDVRDWLVSMRMDGLPELDCEQLEACAKEYRRPAVRHLARYVQKHLATP